MPTIIQDLYVHRGQSIWLDHVARSTLVGKTARQLVQDGLRGINLNLQAFAHELATSPIYDTDICAAYNQKLTAAQTADELYVENIQKAADAIFHIYEVTKGFDGYVTVDINPHVLTTPQAVTQECERLFKNVRRPNVMFNVPATNYIYPTIEKLLSDGININITHIISLEQYTQAARSYIRGLREFVQKGGIPRTLCSIASIHINQIDTLFNSVVDEALQDTRSAEATKRLATLRSNGTITTSAIIYTTFRQLFSSQEFNELQKKGMAHIQRILWNSTYSLITPAADIDYIINGLTHNTINLMNSDTFEQYLEFMELPKETQLDSTFAQQVFDLQNNYQKKIHARCEEVLQAGLTANSKTYDEILRLIEKKQSS